MTSTAASMDLKNKKTDLCILAGISLMLIFAIISLCVGRFPLSLKALFSGDEYQLKVFFTLRLSRVIVGLLTGFVLGVAGYIFQIIFHNPLASPDIIGVSSGASAGAAFGILFFGAAYAVAISSFMGAIIAVFLAIVMSAVDKSGRKSTIILSGIVVHSLAQTVLMCLKITADPERQLASIEYWIMGSLNAIHSGSAKPGLVIGFICVLISFLFHRQLILLSANEDEAKLLGVNVNKMRLFILSLVTLMVSSVISLTGIIRFIGLIAPHCARLITKRNNTKTMLLCGITGGIILCLSDIMARSLATVELPVSIFTSLIGAPFLALMFYRSNSFKKD